MDNRVAEKVFVTHFVTRINFLFRNVICYHLLHAFIKVITVNCVLCMTPFGPLFCYILNTYGFNATSSIDPFVSKIIRDLSLDIFFLCHQVGEI